MYLGAHVCIEINTKEVSIKDRDEKKNDDLADKFLAIPETHARHVMKVK